MRAALTPAAAGRWSSPAVLAILGAQFVTALADNALLLVAIAALEAGSIDPRPLIDAIVPLADALSGFERAAAAGGLKVLLDMR